VASTIARFVLRGHIQHAGWSIAWSAQEMERNTGWIANIGCDAGL
jgi:hypothetical protein